jgi:hypothetical protein
MVRKSFHKPFFWMGVALICALIGISWWATWHFVIHQSRAATIIDVSGSVLFYRHGQSSWISASPGMKIRAGDQLFTQAPDGVVRVGTDDGNIGFQLEPDTLATFTARWNPVLMSGSKGVYIDHGTLMAETLHDLRQSKTRFVVETQAARATIVGSRLVVQALRGIPTTRVSALEGEIRVEAMSDEASILQVDSQPIQEKELVLNSQETVIVYIQQPEPVNGDFDHNQGQVIDSATQEGIQGVVVQVVGSPELFAITDAEGYFTIPGERVYKDLVIAGTTEKMVGNLIIQPVVSRLKDRVVDGITGAGIEKATVTPLDDPDRASVSDSSGMFEIVGLPVGSHSLIVDAEGYLSQIVEARITVDGTISIDGIRLFTPAAIDEVEFLPIILKFSQYP